MQPCDEISENCGFVQELVRFAWGASAAKTSHAYAILHAWFD